MAPIQFGALVYQYQAIDVVGPIDLITNCSQEFLGYVTKHVVIDNSTIERAPQIEVHHIGDMEEPIQLASSNYRIQRTVSVEDCPELDCLLIGGPMPEGFKFPDSYVEFIRRHIAAGKLLFTTCTGAYALATTGLLDGKNATTNNVEYNQIAAEFPRVKWTRTTKWVIDGNIWTASGAVAGMDMIAHWVKESFGLDVLIAGAMGLDYEPRDINGLHTVFPQRFDVNGKQISTTVFPYHE
ncbi:hypothetical protein LTR17_002782 [Elasticomyces elasticus]|nr:hypothetical protein LTR17_002782 [Elasticomyces elasticus]